MENAILISAFIVLIQLFDSYLRWLVFSKELLRNKDLNLNIWQKLFGWSAVAFSIYVFIFLKYGVSALPYKLSLMLGEIPLVGIFIYCFGGNIFRHIFALNMVAVWIFILHSISAFIVVIFFAEGNSDAEIILTHIEIVIGLFIFLLPLERKVFRKIWLPKDFFDIRPQSAYISILPMTILMAHFIRLADNVLIHSWGERFSRIYLPFVFVFFYQYILTTTKMFYRSKKLQTLQLNLKERLIALRDYNNFLTETQDDLRAMRHDLRHAYKLIFALLKSGDIEKALEFVITQKMVLESDSVRPFCKSILINSSLENFLKHAEESGLTVTQKIIIPDNFSTNEDDFALLIANLIKLNISLSNSVKKNSKNFSLVILHADEKFILEIKNNFIPPTDFDSDGLPINFETDSIKNFLKKYSAATNLEKIGNNLKFSIYWRD